MTYRPVSPTAKRRTAGDIAATAIAWTIFVSLAALIVAAAVWGIVSIIRAIL